MVILSKPDQLLLCTWLELITGCIRLIKAPIATGWHLDPANTIGTQIWSSLDWPLTNNMPLNFGVISQTV